MPNTKARGASITQKDGEEKGMEGERSYRDSVLQVGSVIHLIPLTPMMLRMKEMYRMITSLRKEMTRRGLGWV